jgi:hypothetical protein
LPVDDRPAALQQQLDEVHLDRVAWSAPSVVSTLVCTCWLASVMLLAVWLSSMAPAG